MVLLISFLIGIQIVYTCAASTAPSFNNPSCNSLVVKAAAEAALDKVNSNRNEGYVLGLQRIFDVRELPQGDESAFDLILDVLETKCHVRSRKPWRECEFRMSHETVFGSCTITMNFNRKTNDSILHTSNCFLRPLCTRPCPGCPIRQDPSEVDFLQAARESLAKFNAETNHIHNFTIVEVTKASSQVISGFLTTVEFIIQETFCPKNQPNITQCPLIPSETAAAALCEGIMIVKGNIKSLSVKCDFFPHLLSANVTETPPNQMEAVVQVTDCPWSYFKSAECPGKVAIEIRGLPLPSCSWEV